MKNTTTFILMSAAFIPLVFLLVAVAAVGDYALFAIMNTQIVNPVLDFACTYVSPFLFAGFYVPTLVATLLSSDHKMKAAGIVSIVNGILSYGVGSLIKEIVMRPRPELSAARLIEEARIIGLWHTSTFSFPSTTAMLAFGLSFPILLKKPRLGAVLVALSYFMGFSVIYTGFHFPLDVAGGILFSLAITLVTERLENRVTSFLQRRRSNKTQKPEQA